MAELGQPQDGGTSWGQGGALAAVALAITAVSLLMTPVTHQLRSRP